MKESAYKSYDELPLFLNAETVAKVLGVSPSSGYELMHEQDLFFTINPPLKFFQPKAVTSKNSLYRQRTSTLLPHRPAGTPAPLTPANGSSS